MNLDKYNEYINLLHPDLEDRTKRFGDNVQLIHAALGLSGECGEVVDLIKKHVAYGKPLNREALIEEMGDLFHYMSRILTLINSDLEEAVISNVIKLGNRFPNGYSNNAAINKGE